MQALPGGFVTRLNRSCIQVLDVEGEGVFFLLNDDEDDNGEPLPSESDVTYTDEVEYVNVNGDIPDVEFIDDEEDSSEEENDVEDNPDEDTNISNESIDYDDEDEDEDETMSEEEDDDSSQEDEDNTSQGNEDRSIITETTTKIPVSVLDPSRFDVVNDKITSQPSVTEAQTTTTTPEATEVATSIEMETTTLETDPTLNVDPGLLE